MSLQGVLLALLSNLPDTGYGLSRRLRQELPHVWEARLQQIYVELARLHAGGMVDVRRVRQKNRPPKKLYSLTLAGRRALDDWLTGGTEPAAVRDERLMRIHCLGQMPHALLARRLEEWGVGWQADAQTLASRRAQMSRTDPTQLGPVLALEAAIARAECNVAWCARALAALSDRAAGGAEGPPESLRARQA